MSEPDPSPNHSAPERPTWRRNAALWVVAAVAAWLVLQPLVTDRVAHAEWPVPVAGAKVEMWRTSWCPYCARANAYFRSCGLEFVEYDIEASPEAHEALKALGGRGVPLIRVHGRLMSGFDARQFVAIYRSGS
jgi:glutaredoxin